MDINNMAELIILQAFEDLGDPRQRKDSLEFFNGNGFKACAGMAGMGNKDMAQVLELLRDYNSSETREQQACRAGYRPGSMIPYLVAPER
jgi:hypothetical protein